MADLRENFESAISRSLYALLSPEGDFLERGDDGDYKILAVQAAWWAWQMSAKETVKAEQMPDDLTKRYERTYNALDYIYESGELSNGLAIEKAKWGLGFAVENEAEVAALIARFSDR